MIKSILNTIRLVFNLRSIKLLKKIHTELSKDKNYRFFNLLKAMLLVSKHEKINKIDGNYLVSSFLPPIPSEAFMQLFNATPNINSKFYEHANAIRTAPISMFVAITEKCPYNCWHCSNHNRSSKDGYSTEDLKKLMSELQSMGVAIIGITGGEPLMRKDLEQIISSIDNRSMSILYTTGHGLTLEKARELKQSGLSIAAISLDSTDSGKFDELRGLDGAFNIAMEAIENSKKAGLYTMTQTVVTPKSLNDGTIQEIIKLGKKLKVDEIRFLESMPSGKLSNTSKENLLSQQDREKLIKIHKKENWKLFTPKVTVFAYIESNNLFGCGAGTQHSYIDVEGNLCPCDFVPLSFGNIKNNNVSQLWKDMNEAIKVPRDRCMILEINKKINEKNSATTPLNISDSKDICLNCRPMTSLPKFYKTLQG